MQPARYLYCRASTDQKTNWPCHRLIANHCPPKPVLSFKGPPVGFPGVGAACFHTHRCAPMPRYFFNVHFDHHVARDPVGVEVADLTEAVNQARKARAEIMHEDDLAQLWLEIVDERGLVLARVGR